MNKLLLAQDLIDAPGGVSAGFNSRIYGLTLLECYSYPDPDTAIGWHYADRMIKAGKCFFVQRFHHFSKCGGHAFPYGGSWVCNKCGGSRLDQPWWTIRVEKDGNAYCCHGLDFVNLQESDNYAFSDTFQEAVDNYGKMMALKEV